jgi:hypothetical protein
MFPMSIREEGAVPWSVDRFLLMTRAIKDWMWHLYPVRGVKRIAPLKTEEP